MRVLDLEGGLERVRVGGGVSGRRVSWWRFERCMEIVRPLLRFLRIFFVLLGIGDPRFLFLSFFFFDVFLREYLEEDSAVRQYL